MLETKQIGSIRKSKRYKTACGVILGLALVGGQVAQAEEVTPASSTEAVTRTDNPATNLVEAQAIASSEAVAVEQKAGQTSGEIVAPVESSQLEQAVTQAQAVGVTVQEIATQVKDNLPEAQQDLTNQVDKVKEATDTQKEVSSIQKESQAQASSAGVKLTTTPAVIYTNNNKAALDDASEQAGRLQTASETQGTIDSTLPEAVKETKKAGVRVTTEEGKVYQNSQEALSDLTEQVAKLTLAKDTQTDIVNAMAQALADAKKTGLSLSQVAEKVYSDLAAATKDKDEQVSQLAAAIQNMLSANDTIHNKALSVTGQGTPVEADGQETVSVNQVAQKVASIVAGLEAVAKRNTQAMADYETQLAQAEKTNAVVRQYNAETTLSNQKAQTAYQAELASVQETNAAIRQENAETIAKNQAAQASYQEKLKVAQETNAAIREENEQIKAENAKAKADYEAQLAAAKQTNADVAAQNEAIAKENEAIRQRNAAKQAQYEKDLAAYQQAQKDNAEADKKRQEAIKQKESELPTAVSFKISDSSEELNSLSGNVIKDSVVVNSDGSFIIKSPHDDGLGVFENAVLKGHFNYTSSYASDTNQAVVVISSVTLDSFSVENTRPNQAYLQTHTTAYRSPDGELLFTNTHDGSGSINEIPINKTYTMPSTTKLSNGETSKPFAFLVTDESWVVQANTTLFAALSYKSTAPDPEQPTPGNATEPIQPTLEEEKPTEGLVSIPVAPTEKPLKEEIALPVEPEDKPLKETLPLPTPPTMKELKEEVPLPSKPMPEKATYKRVVVEASYHDILVTVPSHDVDMAANIHEVKVATDRHQVEVKQRPSNRKAVYNIDMTDINGQLVAKGSTVVWQLTDEALKAGRDFTESYQRLDYVPEGFELDLAATRDRSPEWTVTYQASNRLLTYTLKAQELEKLNLDLTVSQVIPASYLVGTPTNDGGTYKNTFTTVIKTNDAVIRDQNGKLQANGQTRTYTKVSNTPVVYTPGNNPSAPRKDKDGNDPTPNDNLIQPTKQVVNAKGQDINGKSILPNSEIKYVVKHDFDQYKGIVMADSEILKGFGYIDDLQDSTVSIDLEKVTSKLADGTVVKGLEMTAYASLDEVTDEAVKERIINSGIKPQGYFIYWNATDPMQFYKDYVVKGLSIYHTLPVITGDYVGTFNNKSYQIDFGNGYEANVVSNNIPKLEAIKDVLKSIGSNESINNSDVTLGQTFPYLLDGPSLPLNLDGGVTNVFYRDRLQASHDEYNGEFYAFLDKDVTDKSGQVIAKDTEITKYWTQVLERDQDGKVIGVTYKLDQAFVDSLSTEDGNELDTRIYLMAKRIAYGTDIKNTFEFGVNDYVLTSNTVITHTPKPTPPAPVTSSKEEVPSQPVATTPAKPSQPTLPNTGERGTVLAVITGLLLTGLSLVGLRKKTESK